MAHDFSTDHQPVSNFLSRSLHGEASDAAFRLSDEQIAAASAFCPTSRSNS
jgi:hypothetical protein